MFKKTMVFLNGNEDDYKILEISNQEEMDTFDADVAVSGVQEEDSDYRSSCVKSANVGPVTDGQPQNAIKSAVVDPGTRNFEAMSPGLLYSVTSWVSTLGDILDLTTSALFFDSIDMNFRRIHDITRKKDGTPYFKVTLRSKWVEYLKQRELKTKKLSLAQQHQVTQWILKHDLPMSVDSFSAQPSK